jgi:DHA3 family macrolide efflux protein-like MFS transporter
MGEAFRFIRKWPGFLILLIIAAFVNFVLSPTDTFLPLIVTQHFHLGVWELSLLQSGMGIGIVAGGLLLGIWGGFKNKAVTSMLGVIGIGVGILLVGIAPADLFYLALAGIILSGFMNPMTNGPLQAIMQSKVPPEMQGRVMSFVTSICMAMMPLAMLVSAPVVKLLGLQTWYWASGIITIALGITACFIPQVMALDKTSPNTEQASAAII